MGKAAVVYESPVTLTMVDEPNGTLILITCAFWRSVAVSANTFVVALVPVRSNAYDGPPAEPFGGRAASASDWLARLVNSAAKSNGGAVRVTCPFGVVMLP